MNSVTTQITQPSIKISAKGVPADRRGSFCSAARISVVEVAAAALAALIDDPIPVKSADAVVKASGTALTKDDICGSDYLEGDTTTGESFNQFGDKNYPRCERREAKPQRIRANSQRDV